MFEREIKSLFHNEELQWETPSEKKFETPKPKKPSKDSDWETPTEDQEDPKTFFGFDGAEEE